ncbi:MAG: hypothetical protein WD022_00865, partial [Balneolaceae bacterium]
PDIIIFALVTANGIADYDNNKPLSHPRVQTGILLLPLNQRLIPKKLLDFPKGIIRACLRQNSG